MKACYVNELMIGDAGEHLVCCDLLSRGIRAFQATQTCPYDIAADINDRLIRIQVKTTMCPRGYKQESMIHITGYVWTARRGKGARRVYGDNEFDILALVALDIKRVAYLLLSDIRQTIQIPIAGNATKCKSFDDYTIDRVLESLL